MDARPNLDRKPGLVHRPSCVYAFVPHRVTLGEIGAVSTASFASIAQWLDRHGVAVAGAPFLRYRRIDMSGTLDIETGIPIEAASRIADGMEFGEVPAGRYARLFWNGAYDRLVAGNTELIASGRQQGIQWDMATGADGDRFGARLETFLVGPAQESDPAKWLTEIAIRVAEGRD